MKDERERDEDEPLELVPMEEQDGDDGEDATRALLPGEEEPADQALPAAPPLKSDDPVRTEETKKRLEEEERTAPPPRLAWADAGRILQWPLQGAAGQNLLTAAAVYLVALTIGGFLGFLFGHLPVLGPWLAAILRVGFAVGGLLFLLEIAWHLVVAALRGRLVVQAVFGGPRPREGFRLAILGALYFAPPTILGFGTRSLWVGALAAMAAWTLFPAAVVLAAATDRLSEGNPVTALRFVLRAGRSWIAVVSLILPLFVLRLLVGSGLPGLLIEGVAGLLLVYAFLLAALVAKEKEDVAALLLEIGEGSRP